jgi:hypothetical protein
VAKALGSAKDARDSGHGHPPMALVTTRVFPDARCSCHQEHIHEALPYVAKAERERELPLRHSVSGGKRRLADPRCP